MKEISQKEYWEISNSSLGREELCILFIDGNRQYIKNKVFHRVDGPAIDYKRKKEWWINGEKLSCTTQREFESYMKLKMFW